MIHRDAPTFFAQLLKLGKAMGEVPDEERMEIYYQDLSPYSLEQVLEALTWARRSLTHFPKLSELIHHIEGHPEILADSAWRHLKTMVTTLSADASLDLDDPVFAKVLVEQWGSWPAACTAFRLMTHPADEHEARRLFLARYLEWHAKRYEIEQSESYLMGLQEYQSRYDTSIATVVVYHVGRQGSITKETKRLASFILDDPVVPLPEYYRRKLDEMLDDIGKPRPAPAQDVQPTSGAHVIPFYKASTVDFTKPARSDA